VNIPEATKDYLKSHLTRKPSKSTSTLPRSIAKKRLFIHPQIHPTTTADTRISHQQEKDADKQNMVQLTI